MKKIILLLAVLLLAGCGNEKEEVDLSNKNIEASNTGSQEELNSQLKNEAVQADFVEMNVDNPPNGKKVYVDGEVSVIFENTFVLTSEEEKGKGMYKIELFNTTDMEYAEGDQVRVYGVVNGKDETGMPKITATILEK